MLVSWCLRKQKHVLLNSAGIPKFYRWLSERYPLLNQPTDVGETPLVDNLYLDMNGIIHNCTHGNDPGTKLTEEEMIVKVFGYLDKLFQVVKPQRLLFMAIDGEILLQALLTMQSAPLLLCLLLSLVTASRTPDQAILLAGGAHKALLPAKASARLQLNILAVQALHLVQK